MTPRPAPGVERVVAVLNFLAAHPDESFTLSELARRLDLNKATCHALLMPLTQAGYLLRHPTRMNYTLGPALDGVEHLRAFLAAQEKSPNKPVSMQGDPVHPGPPGQLMMAAALLKALSADVKKAPHEKTIKVKEPVAAEPSDRSQRLDTRYYHDCNQRQ